MSSRTKSRADARGLVTHVARWACLVSLACLACREGTRPDASIPHPSLEGSAGEVRTQIEAARSSVAAHPGAASIGRLGMLYQTYGFDEAARACYREAASRAPAQFRWHYALALVEHELGDGNAARAALGRALEVDADSLPALIHLSRLELERNDAAQAHEFAARALLLHPDSAAAHAALGRAAAALGDFTTARDRLGQALRLEPRSSELAYRLGLVYRELGQPGRAAELLARAGDVPVPVADPFLAELKELRRGPLAHQQEADRLVASGRPDRAVEHLRHALEAQPGEVRLQANLGHLLADLGRLEQAEQELLRAVELDPTHAPSWYNLGVVRARRGRDGEALEAYRRALGIDPLLVEAHLNAGHASHRLGRFEEAVEHFGRVQEDQPAHARAALQAALIEMRIGDWLSARDRLEHALRLAPEDDALLLALVRVLAAAPDDAARDGSRARALAPRLGAEPLPPEHAVALAMIAAETGDYDTAVRLQEGLLASLPRAAPTGLRETLELDLERYRKRLPCRRPWSADDPVLAPSPAVEP